MNYIYFVLIIVILGACSSMTNFETKAKTQVPPEQALLLKTYNAHGGELYNSAHYSFQFRGKDYSFHNDGPRFRYSVQSEKNRNITEDILNNTGIRRTINGVPAKIDENRIAGYTGSLNSVIYFATLPHKLLDPAVNKEFIGETIIKGQNYKILKVYFNEEGGGTDHDDVFHYWINTSTSRIDYLAYNYTVNKGGVRFREAYNPRVIDGILFQDYVNYKADVGTPLIDLPGIFENKRLKKLSVIETKNVVNMGGK